MQQSNFYDTLYSSNVWIYGLTLTAFHERPIRRASHVRHGHSGQAHRTGLTLAERLCRTVDRIAPARMSGSRYRLGRGTSAPNLAILRSLLQRK